MTPLQKANELFDKYMGFDFNTIVNRTQRQYAKECALITVNEILKTNPIELVGTGGKFKYKDEYWKEVKTLLESF